MKYIALFLLIGFITISVFSFGIMNHDENHGIGNCVASLIDKVVCPQIGLATVLHHLNFYQIFSETFLSSPVSVYMAMFLILFGAIFFLPKKSLDKKNLMLLFQYSQYEKNKQELFLHEPRQITAWLSLFENSPSA